MTAASRHTIAAQDGARATCAVVRVALDVPLATLFDYLPPGDSTVPADALIGRRVRVPFGRGDQVGVVMAVAADSEVALHKLKPIRSVLDPESVFPVDVLELIAFAARYYHHPIGQCVAAALPAALRDVARAAVPRARPAFRLSEVHATMDIEDLPSRARAQRAIVAALRAHSTLTSTQLREIVPNAPGALRALLQRGIVEQRASDDWQFEVIQASNAGDVTKPRLTEAQRAVVDAIRAVRTSFTPFLLHGVTGSGKTEIYLQLVEATLAAGGQALLLVPEIGLTPQLVDRVQARFREPIAALHSNLAEGERLRRWQATRTGRARIVIGTRLAVFAPMPQLGLVVVDEEHDASFKQQDGLRYSARDLALFRAKLRNVPILLGSATPSLESYAHAREGRYRLLELPQRAAAALPRIQTVDSRHVKAFHGLTPTLIDAIKARMERREQSLVFVNRRGYAPALVCSACGWASCCPRCSAKLVLHLRDRRLCCHYCGHQARIDSACAACGNQDLLPAGQGTQRIEQALREALPNAVIVRVDRDSTRGRDAFVELQRDVRAQRVDVLVGTQMLVKGHDFPLITLVGVLNADATLFSADFRAPERLYAQLTQVAGRAGRAERPGDVLIQTAFPEHPLYEAVCRQDYRAFASAALRERRDTGFPPYAFQALLRAEAHRREAVDAYLLQAAAAGMAIDAPVEIYDPAPPVIARIAGMERGQLLVQASSRGALQQFLTQWTPQLASRAVRWSLDVDPLDF